MAVMASSLLAYGAVLLAFWGAAGVITPSPSMAVPCTARGRRPRRHHASNNAPRSNRRAPAAAIRVRPNAAAVFGRTRMATGVNVGALRSGPGVHSNPVQTDMILKSYDRVRTLATAQRYQLVLYRGPKNIEHRTISDSRKCEFMFESYKLVTVQAQTRYGNNERVVKALLPPARVPGRDARDGHGTAAECHSSCRMMMPSCGPSCPVRRFPLHTPEKADRREDTARNTDAPSPPEPGITKWARSHSRQS
jgi:hypothetical protein